MTHSFDPFGDAATKGYLRNIHNLPLGDELKDLEWQDTWAFLPDALAALASHRKPGYKQLLQVHRDLFCGLYPWAGKDRFMLFPNSMVSKGNTQFALSNNIEKAFDIAMKSNNTFGQTLGHLAYAHPFLEGNGRAIFAFFDDHLRRKGVVLNWATLQREKFLIAIDKQILNPQGNDLDDVLKPHLSHTTKTDPKNSVLLKSAFATKQK